MLQISDLTVHYGFAGGPAIPAVINASLSIEPGETVGLLGESGSGKTTLALSILRLLPHNARIAGGSIRFRNRELFDMAERELEKVRGAEISIIFQEPALALNPVLRVGDQVAEVIRAHSSAGPDRCRSEAVRLLEQVRLRDAAGIYSAYPHQLSGGQRQRVAIAQALACSPALVIADEPTTGLDTCTQAEILALLKELKQQTQTAFLFISHHPGVLSALADRIFIMYAGRIIEEGEPGSICGDPLHPFTRGLLQCMPEGWIETNPAPRRRLVPIDGGSPDMADLPRGCAFAPRCPAREAACLNEEPKVFRVDANRWVRCIKYDAERNKGR